MDQYALWLYEAAGYSRSRIFHLRKAMGEDPSFAEKLYYLTDRDTEELISRIPDYRGMNRRLSEGLCRARKKDPARAAQQLWEKEMEFAGFDDPCYPEKLKNIPDPPYGIYYIGNLPDPRLPSLAVVGARKTTPYGREQAGIFCRKLAAHGIQIISGMARGIDGIAGRTAIEAGGTSFAVLGCGADICYPPENEDLYSGLAQYGGVISEYPPGTKPVARFFPSRNRIISGLADALFVVEARLRSGTQITAGSALEQGKDIFALPGRVSDDASAGCISLLRDGAFIAASPEDILEYFFGVQDGAADPLTDFAISGRRDHSTRQEAAGPWVSGSSQEFSEAERDAGQGAGLSGTAAAVYRCLDDSTPKDLEEVLSDLKEETGTVLKPQELLAQLTLLCVSGHAQQADAGFYIARHPLPLV